MTDSLADLASILPSGALTSFLSANPGLASGPSVSASGASGPAPADYILLPSVITPEVGHPPVSIGMMLHEIYEVLVGDHDMSGNTSGPRWGDMSGNTSGPRWGDMSGNDATGSKGKKGNMASTQLDTFSKSITMKMDALTSSLDSLVTEVGQIGKSSYGQAGGRRRTLNKVRRQLKRLTRRMRKSNA